MAKANPVDLESDRLDMEPGVKICDAPGCNKVGEFKAPKSRDQLREYFWFCLDHVREYNKSWNYYSGMSDNDVEADIRRSTTWDRPSWRFGATPGNQKGQAFNGVKDPFGFFDEKGEEEAARQERQRYARTPEGEAAQTLGLEPPLTLENLKSKYKELVKMYHPDANGGDKAAEERLKTINEAYTTLRRLLK